MPNRFPAFAATLALTALPLATPALAKDPPVKVSQGQAVKGQSKVVVGAFNVGFIFESLDKQGKQNAGGLAAVVGGPTKLKSKLVGVTPEMMQAVTDAAYADFVGQLTTRGYTVADPGAFFASPEMAKAKPSAAPFEVKVQLEKNSDGKSYYYKPTALPKQYFFGGDVMMSQQGMFSGFAAMGPGMQAAGVSVAATNYAKANNVAVISVAYLIDFSQVRRPGAFSFGSAKVNTGMAVVDEFSKLTLINPQMKTATVLIKQPVAVEGDFADMKDATKGKGMQTATNVAGGLAAGLFGIGGIGVGKSRTYEFTVKPETYTPGASKAAALANTVVVDQLVALR